MLEMVHGLCLVYWGETRVVRTLDVAKQELASAGVVGEVAQCLPRRRRDMI